MVQRNDRYLDKGLQVWIARTAKRNFWRVASWYDLDDLIQDGYIVWARVRAKYPDLQMAQFVALFKISYINRIHNLANKRTRSISEVSFDAVVTPDGEALDTGDVGVGLVPEEGTLAVKLAQAPLCVTRFLAAFETEAGRRALQGQLRQTSRHKETINERLCRVAGVDPEAIDMVWEVKNALADA
jgi:hypothetical protein